MIYEYFSKNNIEEIKSKYGEVNVEFEEGVDEVKLYFSKNIELDLWNKINDELTVFSSSKGYSCNRNDDMMLIVIKPADSFVEVLKTFIRPVFTNVKKMIIEIVLSILVIFLASLFLVYLQTRHNIFTKNYWIEYKVFGLYYIILYILSTLLILYVYSNKHIKEIIKSSIANSFWLELFTYITIFSVKLLFSKNLSVFDYFYFLLDSLVVSFWLSLFISYLVFQYRRYMLESRHEEKLKEYNRMKSALGLSHLELLEYAENNKVKLDEILLPKSGINDLYGLMNVKTIEEEQNTILFPLLWILITLISLLVFWQFSFLFSSLRWFEIIFFILIVIINILLKTKSVLKVDKMRLIYAIYHLRKLNNYLDNEETELE